MSEEDDKALLRFYENHAAAIRMNEGCTNTQETNVKVFAAKATLGQWTGNAVTYEDYRDLEQRLSASRAECERLTKERNDAINRAEQDRQRNVRFTNAIVEARTERDAALARVRQVWQPIETAPKDGSSIIGKFGSLVFRMNWQAYNLFGPQKPEGGCEVVGQRHGWSYVGGDSCCEGFPTHWIPMPDTALQP